ncbi:hypothetical protein ACFYPN_33305 [Streptomyces sp. NPDC005576]|uniref:hypothetical protein n=1 Tax=unclassified Streptomyces TaxID=2593676 RepID=UPI0033F5A7E3
MLAEYARQGCDREYEHQISGGKIGYIPDVWEQPDSVPGQEDLVVSRNVPWGEHFDTASARFVTRRLNELEKDVVRVWAGNAPIPWTEVPALVGQDASRADHSRRKVRRLGDEWLQREENRGGLG